MALRAVKRTRIHDELVEQIRRHVVDGRLRPGDQLPSERVLSARLKVSRASLREAIRSLEPTGLFQIRSREGIYVAAKPDVGLDLWRSAIAREEGALRAAFEARKILEPQIAALAASRATAVEISQLEAILVEQARQVANGRTGMAPDTAFHALLARATKNQLLLKLNQSIVDGLRESRERSLRTPGRPARSLAGHRKILDAIRARNPARARTAMLRHLQEIERNAMKVGAARPRQPAGARGGRTKRVA